VDAVSPIGKPRGRPRKRPKKLHADKGYDFGRCRKGVEEEGHNPSHRPARDRVEQEAGAAPVGGGADAVVAESLPAAEGALRAAGRHPPGLTRSRLRPDLLALRPTVLVGALSVAEIGRSVNPVLPIPMRFVS
jgi:hypothetical protein